MIESLKNSRRIYISGPITGVENFQERFDAAEELLTANGHEVINPTNVMKISKTFSWGEYMEIDLALLGLCDTIVLLPGWKQSKGCAWEYEYAKSHGHKIYEM